jgi:hypothetical protein
MNAAETGGNRRIHRLRCPVAPLPRCPAAPVTSPLYRPYPAFTIPLTPRRYSLSDCRESGCRA